MNLDEVLVLAEEQAVFVEVVDAVGKILVSPIEGVVDIEDGAVDSFVGAAVLEVAAVLGDAGREDELLVANLEDKVVLEVVEAVLESEDGGYKAVVAVEAVEVVEVAVAVGRKSLVPMVSEAELHEAGVLQVLLV